MPLDTRQWNLPLALHPKACIDDMSARFHPGVPLPDAAELQARSVQPLPFKSWTHDKESCGKRFSLSDMRSWCAAATTPHGGVLESGLMILDQSGNQTRLLRCPFPLGVTSHAAPEPVKLSELQHGVDEFDENYINVKETEMHEDTEEINALLYSDDDYDEDCESDDEVMSTGHSPYPLEQVYNKRQLEEIDGPCKRQRLLDKVENISGSSSLVGTTSSTKLNRSYFLMDENIIAESNISTKEDPGSDLSNEQSRKDKIRTALKILESIVPGAKGNEALLLLDEAIDYLKLLKHDLISTEIKNHH